MGSMRTWGCCGTGMLGGGTWGHGGCVRTWRGTMVGVLGPLRSFGDIQGVQGQREGWRDIRGVMGTRGGLSPCREVPG